MLKGPRIIAGGLKNSVLELPRQTELRPTSARVRAAAFSVLQSRCKLADFVVLDLYAGSGAYGIESLSRGALFACFVEEDTQLCRALQANLERLGLRAQSQVLRMNLPQGLEHVRERCAALQLKQSVSYLIFADPPYAKPPGRSC